MAGWLISDDGLARERGRANATVDNERAWGGPGGVAVVIDVKLCEAKEGESGVDGGQSVSRARSAAMACLIDWMNKSPLSPMRGLPRRPGWP